MNIGTIVINPMLLMRIKVIYSLNNLTYINILVLRNHGIEEENIITFMYDDVADSDDNPFPGKLFNRPKGEDVYREFLSL
jgi:glycosylphosphatidylinositol transamidase (GPIT) subunit GPI8